VRRENMLGRKSNKETGTSNQKKLSPRDVLIQKVEQIADGQQLLFQMPELYGGDIIIIELTPGYPSKGKKYSVVSTDPVGGKPGDKRRTLWDTDKPKVIADWILEKNGRQID
jgi:hypothetical protein